MDEFRIRRVTGPDLAGYIPALARLRIAVFRDYPYLYDGDPDYEARYLADYATARGSVVVLALDGERVVGAATGKPLAVEKAAVQAPFLAAGHDPAQVFYHGESVLLPDYRGHGLGVRFFAEREAHARELAADPASGFGPLRWFAFCAVARDPDDPRRPPDHVPLDAFWHKRGYVRHDELRTEFTWKELGAERETAQTMVFWLKPAGRG